MAQVPYQYYNTEVSSQNIIDPTQYLAQTFTVGNGNRYNVTFECTSVLLYLSRTGNPGTLQISIRETDVDGLPTGPDLTTATTNGDTLAVHPLKTSRSIRFSPYIALNPDTKYAIVLHGATTGVANQVRWRCDDVTASYAGGSCCVSADSGVTWGENTAVDFYFQVYGVPIYQTQSPTQGVRTFGNTTLPDTLYSIQENGNHAYFGTVVYCPESGYAQSISIHATLAPNTAGTIHCALYRYMINYWNDGGIVKNTMDVSLIAETESKDMVQGWNTCNFSPPLQLTPGFYMLASKITSSNAFFTRKSDTSEEDECWVIQSTAGSTFESTATLDTCYTKGMIYCTYLPVTAFLSLDKIMFYTNVR